MNEILNKVKQFINTNYAEWIQLITPHVNNKKVTFLSIVAILYTVVNNVINQLVSDEVISQALLVAKVFIGEQCRLDNPTFFTEMIDTKLRNMISYQTYYVICKSYDLI